MMTDSQTTDRPEDFVARYEAASATQEWSNVAPLISEDACVTFSDGSVYRGKADVERAFTRNFQLIENDSYSMSNLHWLTIQQDIAVYVFDFEWAGTIGGEFAQGKGRGTGVLQREDGVWRLLAEHLGAQR